MLTNVPGAPVTITNVSDKALDYFQTNGTYPDGYFFWDIVHPTTQGHALVAGLALQAMAAVPEPATYAMAIAGLACGSYLVRRRRKRA